MIKSTIFAVLCASLALGCNKKPEQDTAAPKATEAKATEAKTAPKAEEKKMAQAPIAEPGEVSVTQLSDLHTKKMVTIFDANGADTRKELGIIPGAKLLTHYKDYALSELPAEKTSKMVYYCSNTQCGASHAAATKAIAAGYQDVHVLKVGVAGWKEAGQEVAAYN